MNRMSWVWGTGILAACLVVLGCKPGSVAVPDVLGMTQAEASAAITGAGLTLGTVTETYSETIASGLVVGQLPASGASVSAGAMVALSVSNGPPLVEVPNVVGQTASAASATLTGAGLAVGTVTEAFSPTVASGLVLSQLPAADTFVSPGSAVSLTVSKGPQPVPVPDVVGQPQTEAAAVIASAGLVPGSVTEEFSETVAVGLVISQVPAAGTLVSPGSALALNVSKGPQMLAVPNVVGETQDAAAISVETAGLTVGTVAQAFSDTEDAGLIIGQQPPADTLVDSGSCVALVLSKGPRPVTVPNQIFNFGGNVTMEFVWIPGGTFTMGSPEGEPGREEYEGPPHPVTVTGFWMGKYEMTQAQWLAISGTNPSHFAGDKLPVEQLPWSQCQGVLLKYCKEMGWPTDMLRLPSEAEWEYACRAGSDTPWHFGADPSLLDSFAWVGRGGDSQTHQVGQKLQNDFGLYDMLGNVQEWCQDSWHSSYEGAPVDGGAWLTFADEYRVTRGGAHDLNSSRCRSGSRFCANLQTVSANCGLRIVWNH